MQNFMKDRYGVDELTTIMGFGGMILALIGALAHWTPLSWIALGIVVIALLRALSKNIDARSRENHGFVTAAAKVPGLGAIVAKLSESFSATGAARSNGPSMSSEDVERAKRLAKRMWKERKTTAFLKCPACGQVLAVPKGKGKIRVRCPKCGCQMETRS